MMSSQGKMEVTALSSTSVLDWFKPLRSEAIARLRTNSVGLVGLAILSNLLPVPSLWRAFDVVWQRRPVAAPYYYLCAVGAWHAVISPCTHAKLYDTELFTLGVLALNVLQAAYALKYPRAPLPPPPSPAKPAKTPLSPPTRQWRLQGLTPTVSLASCFSSHRLTCCDRVVHPSKAKGVLDICPLTCLHPFTRSELQHPSPISRRIGSLFGVFRAGLSSIAASCLPRPT